MTEDRIVSDAIFGFITLKPHINTIIDTPQFQRLRHIWQLGMTPFVYPTADHSRFEHSIGTYHLASRLLSQIQGQKYKDPEDKPDITEKDIKCVEIAALCHDIGHGPFSHVWDDIVLPDVLKKEHVSHEKQFPKIWKILKGNKKVQDMVEDNELDKIIDNKKGGETYERLISDLINGKFTDKYKGKEILFGIVSNSESGMDVDKWDYLARDSSYLGHSSTNYRADIERMIHRARAIKDGDIWKIAFRDTEAINMLRVFQLRHYIHQTACRHRTVVAIDQMFLDGVKECIDGVSVEGETVKILDKEKIGTAEWIIENTDSIFWSNVSKVKTFQRILARELYKPILEVSTCKIFDDPTLEIWKKLKDGLNEVEKSKLLNNLRIVFCKFKLGNKDGNPILQIPFYNKSNEIFRFKEEDLPSHLKLDCNESRVIIFSTSTDNNFIDVKEKLIKYFKETKINDNWKIQNN